MREILPNEAPLKNIVSHLTTAAIIGLIIVLPFALLELTFTTVTNASGFIVLFGALWLLAAAFVVAVLPLAQNLIAGKAVAAKPFNLLLRAALAMLILSIWLSIVIDQLPCFLGVPNCD